MTSETEPWSRPALVLGWWVTLLAVADLYLVPPLLPEFLHRYSADLSGAARILGVYQIGAAVAVLAAGYAVDRFGFRFVLTGALTFFSVGELLSGRAPRLEAFLFGRGLVGVGSASISLALLTYIGRHVPYSLRGKAMGILGTAYFVGICFGPLLSTEIATRTDLETLFLSYAILAASGILAACFVFPSKGAGTFLGRVDNGFLAILRNRNFWGIVLIQSLFSFGFVSMIQYFGEWLGTTYGMSARERGIVFALGGIPTLFGSPVGGRLCDRFGKKKFFGVLTVILSVMACRMPYLTTDPALTTAAFGLIGFIAAARFATYQALSTRLVEGDLLGHLLALRNFLNYLVSAAGVWVMGMVYASSPRFGYNRMGWITAGLLLVSVGALWKLIPPEPKRAKPSAAA